jgi:hypothetical protein
MCEILVYAKVQWMEEVSEEEKDKWGVKMWAKYNRRLVKGNPIVVKPDGWKWGKRECPPDFVVLKIPNMTVKEGEKYLTVASDRVAELTEDGSYPVLHKKRYRFDVDDVDVAKLAKGIINTTSIAFLEKLTDRQP